MKYEKLMNGWAGKAQWDLTEWAAKCRPLAQLQIRLRGVSRDARERKVVRCGLRSPDPASPVEPAQRLLQSMCHIDLFI